MANFLGNSDFNVGQDISVTIISDQGANYSAEALGHLVDIDVDRESEMARVKPCSGGGVVLRMGIPQGVKGKLVFARVNAALERELLAADALWYNSKIKVNFTFQFQIANRDGSVNSYMIPNATVGAGKFLGGKADKEVNQEITFEGPQIIPT